MKKRKQKQKCSEKDEGKTIKNVDKGRHNTRKWQKRNEKSQNSKKIRRDKIVEKKRIEGRTSIEKRP